MNTPFYRKVVKSCLLGLSSLVINLAILSIAPGIHLPLGTLILLITTGGYGLLGSLAASSISEFPLVFCNAHTFSDAFRIILLMSSLGFFTEKFPEFQSGITFIGCWIISSAISACLPGAIVGSWIHYFCFELLLYSLSRMILFSETLSVFIYDKFHRQPLFSFIPEMLFITVSLPIGIVLFQQINGEIIIDRLNTEDALLIAILYAVISILSPIFGYMLTKTLISEYSADLIAAAKSNQSSKSFVSFSRKLFKNEELAKAEVDTTKYEQLKAMLAIDNFGCVMVLTDAAAEILGLITSDCLGKSLYQLSISPSLKSSIEKTAEQTKLKGIIVHDEARIPGKDDFTHRFIHIEAQATNEGIIFYLNEITDKRTIEKTLLEAKRTENLGVMVQGVSSSISEALSAIETSTQLALNTISLQEKDKILGQILSIADSTGIVVSQLLDFSQDAGSSRVKIDFNSYLRDNFSFFKKSIGDKFTLNLNLSTDPLSVRINTDLLNQALTHLLLNSRESYEDQAGTINISSEEEEISEELAPFQPGAKAGRYARVRVQDHGKGMTSEVLTRAFDPRSSLGLSIVYSVIRAHDGFLTVETHPDKGTSVSLYIPIDLF